MDEEIESFSKQLGSDALTFSDLRRTIVQLQADNPVRGYFQIPVSRRRYEALSSYFGKEIVARYYRVVETVEAS